MALVWQPRRSVTTGVIYLALFHDFHDFCSFVFRHLCPVSRSIKMPYFGYNTLLAESLRSFLPLPDLFRKIEGDSVGRVRLQMLLSKSAFCSFSVLAVHLPERSFFFWFSFKKIIIKSGLSGCHAFPFFRYCIYCVGLLVKRCRKKRFSKRFILFCGSI